MKLAEAMKQEQEQLLRRAEYHAWQKFRRPRCPVCLADKVAGQHYVPWCETCEAALKGRTARRTSRQTR